MGSQSSTYADQLEASADEMITLVEDLSDEDWTKIAPADGRQINVIVDHVAQTHPAVFMLVEMMLDGKPLPPITMDMIHGTNAEHAAGSAAVTKESALVALRINAETAAARIRLIDDADLQKSAPFALSESGTISISAIIEHVLIGHSQDHLTSIQGALS